MRSNGAVPPPNLRFRSALSVLAATSLALTTAACGTGDRGGASGSTTLTVYAAASLTGAFTDPGRLFEKDHPGVKVVLSFGGSADLVSQIQEGAPADVFASADVKNMEKVTAAHLEGEAPRSFASNTL